MFARGEGAEAVAAAIGLRLGTASALRTMPAVRNRVAVLQGATTEDIKITTESLLAMFTAQATFDPAIFKGINTPEELEAKVSEKDRRLYVKGWKHDRAGRMVLDLVDKSEAANRLARHVSFYNDTVKVDLSGFMARVAAARARQAQVVSDD